MASPGPEPRRRFLTSNRSYLKERKTKSLILSKLCKNSKFLFTITSIAQKNIDSYSITIRQKHRDKIKRAPVASAI